MDFIGFGNPEAGAGYFHETFEKNGVYEGMVYAGGMDKEEYEYNRENLKRLNKSYMERINKVLETTSNETATGTTFSSTSGSIPTLLPLWLSPDIINLTNKSAPLYALIRKEAFSGKFYSWNKLTAATAAFKREDAVLDEQNDSYAMATVQLKYAYAIGRVTGPMMVHSRSYINMERQQVLVRTKMLVQLIENKMLNGDKSTYPQEFDGLKNLISTNSTTLSDSISLSAIRTSIMHCQQGGESYSSTISGAMPDLIVTDLSTFKDLKALVDPYNRYMNTTKIAWGITALEIDGIPVITSQFMTTTSGSKALYVLNTSAMKLVVAQDLTFERLAKTNDSNKFMVKWYGALVLDNERLFAQIVSIS